MSSPQEQFAELTRRTQENFKNLWQQWSERSTELMKGLGARSQPTTSAPGNPEEVLDAVFDFAETHDRAAAGVRQADAQGHQQGPGDREHRR